MKRYKITYWYYKVTHTYRGYSKEQVTEDMTVTCDNLVIALNKLIDYMHIKSYNFNILSIEEYLVPPKDTL